MHLVVPYTYYQMQSRITGRAGLQQHWEGKSSCLWLPRVLQFSWELFCPRCPCAAWARCPEPHSLETLIPNSSQGSILNQVLLDTVLEAIWSLNPSCSTNPRMPLAKHFTYLNNIIIIGPTWEGWMRFLKHLAHGSMWQINAKKNVESLALVSVSCLVMEWTPCSW